MAKMNSETPLDYAVFHLSPKHSRCELFVTSDGNTEKLASGLLKPFVSHLQIAEEQLAAGSQSVKLEVGRQKNAETWFTKGTLERFVRFVSTPEVLELVNIYDAEMSQLEAARRMYSQGVGDQVSGGNGSGVTPADDATKKELLRAIDVRLLAVKQDLSTACARAAAAGFNIDTVSELQMFADRFGAHRLNEACGKFIFVSGKRPEVIQPSKLRPDDRALRSSYGSDMSIDDDTTSPPHEVPITSQQPNPTAVTLPLSHTLSRESSVDTEKTNNALPEKDRKHESSTPDQTVSIQASQPTRRLSVQDRISMFENKQKENSGGKPPAVVAKPVELRRLSSDLSAAGAPVAEKAVLRRWSGASDMSIDLSFDKKDTESPLCTPTASAVASQGKKVSNSNDGTAEISSVAKPEIKIIPSLGSGESDGLKHQGHGKTRSMSFIGRAEDQDFSEYKNLSGSKNEGVDVLGNQRQESSVSQAQIIVGDNDRVSSATQIRSFTSKGGEHLQIPNQRGEFESMDDSSKQFRKTATQKTAVESVVQENDAGSKIKGAFAARYKGYEGDFSAQKEVKTVREIEVAEKKAVYFPEKVSSTHVSRMEESGQERLQSNRQGSTGELNKKERVKREESSFSGNSKACYSGKVEKESREDIDSFSTPPPDQVQRIRQSKGNQELNDELKMKATELEKLFAEHKSRPPIDQSNLSARKGRSGERDTQHEPSSSLHNTKPLMDITPSQSPDSYQSIEPPTKFSNNSTKFSVESPVKMVDAMDKDLSELCIQEGSRGKLYDAYMQKRSAKLREDWSSNRAEKESRLKSMHDSLERNRSEMKAKISGATVTQDYASSSQRRAERLKSCNKLIMKREQQYLDFVDSEDDEKALDFNENRALDSTLFRDTVSKGPQGKKHLPNNRNLSSTTTPRTSAAPIPKSATKSSVNSGKRRMQMESPLAQSVPNFSDLKKENAKPSSGATSKTTRSQARSYARSRSTNEEAVIVREDNNKSRRSHSLRKSSANPSDFGEMCDGDNNNLAPIKFDAEVVKNTAVKPFLRKGSRASFVSQTSTAREKAFLVSEFIKNDEENEDMESGTDDFASACKDEMEQESEDLNVEELLNDGEPKQELENENGDMSMTMTTTTYSHMKQDLELESELPAADVDPMQDWPEESPISWNYGQRQNPFSYPHEMSDVDSPDESPTSWNSHSFNQVETDSARMRKKWGMTQKPMLVAQSSNSLARKDMKAGFKRLLKFGRKSRGSDILADWVSATTSEGDDDIEDGRDPANRSSDDLRKSRMGFPHAQNSDDAYNESNFFNESAQSSQISIPTPPASFKLRDDHTSGSSIKAPRSFFSLSTFRSKGSESKPR